MSKTDFRLRQVARVATVTSLSLLLTGGGMFGESRKGNRFATIFFYLSSIVFVFFASSNLAPHTRPPPTFYFHRHHHFFLSNKQTGPALSPALARTPDDVLGIVSTEIETLEPIVAEDAAAIEQKLGKKEAQEIVQEVANIESTVEKLERRADDAVGAETPALDAAAKPLLSRIAQIRNIVGLVDDNAAEAR